MIQEDSGSPGAYNFSYIYQASAKCCLCDCCIDCIPLCQLSSRGLLQSHSGLERHILDSKWQWFLGLPQTPPVLLEGSVSFQLNIPVAVTEVCLLKAFFCLSADFCCPCCSLTFSFLCLKGVRFCATLLTGYQLPVKDCKRKFLFCFLTRFLLPLASICYPIVIIFSGLRTKRTGCNSWKMHLQETKPKHCHHFPLTEIYNHSKERAKKVILFISSFWGMFNSSWSTPDWHPSCWTKHLLFYHCFKHASVIKFPHYKYHAIS